jgi:hypothetical protein
MNRARATSAPGDRVRPIVLAGLAILGLAAVLFAGRRPLMMTAPARLAGRWHGCYDTCNGFAPIRFAALRSMLRILALGAGCSVLVETAQYVFRLDRVSSVDDVLVNAGGAVLCGLASRHGGAAWDRSHRAEPRIECVDVSRVLPNHMGRACAY